MNTIVRTESMLLLRNKFLTIPLLMNMIFWLYVIISHEIQDVHIQERAAVFYDLFVWILLINLLIIGLFSVYMVSRDRESEFESLIITYRVKNSEWIVGKWLVTQLYGLCITLITLFIQVGWFASSGMGLSHLIKNGIYLFVQFEGAFFIVISLGFLCGVLIKSVFAYLVVPALLVLSVFLPFDYVGGAYTFDNPRLHLFTPFDYMFIESPYEGIWGIDRVFSSSLLHQLVVFLIGMIILLGALLLFRSNRQVGWEKNSVIIGMVVLMIPALFFGISRFNQYNDVFHAYITTAKMYVQEYEDSDGQLEYYQWENSYYDSSLDHEPYEFSIDRTDLTVQLSADDQLDVASELEVKYHGEKPVNEVIFTLYHGLEVTECSSDLSITCQRDKDFLTVQFEEMIEPLEAFDLTLNYQGNILQFRDEGYTEQAFIDKNRVYLPKEAAWYPLIGERQLIVAREHNNRYVGFEQRNGRLVEDYPTVFTVELMNNVGNIPLALTIPETETGVYQGTSEYGLSLIGGNIGEINVDGIRVVGHPEVLGGAKEIVKKYQQGWNFIEQWLDVPMTPSVIYIVDEKHSYLTWYTPSQEFLVWDHRKLKQSDREFLFDLNNYVTGDLQFDSGDSEDPGYQSYEYLRLAIDWIILNEFGEMESFKDWYINLWFAPEIESEDEHVLMQLNHYAEQGDDVFADVVKYLYDHVMQLDDANDFDMESALQLYEEELGL